MAEPDNKGTIECPKDRTNRYYIEVCRTIFRKSMHRPWCRECRHFDFESSAGTHETSPPETKIPKDREA